MSGIMQLSFAAIIARLQGQADSVVAGILCGDVFNPDYANLFRKGPWPQIWVLSQRDTPTERRDNNFTSKFRQNVQCQVFIRGVTQRFLANPADDTTGAKARLDVVSKIIGDALLGWAPPGAQEVFSVVSAMYGPQNDTLCTIDVVVKTVLTYSK